MDLGFAPLSPADAVPLPPADAARLAGTLAIARAAQAGAEQADPAAEPLAPCDGAFSGTMAASLQRWRHE